LPLLPQEYTHLMTYPAPERSRAPLCGAGVRRIDVSVRHKPFVMY
jgi:hypothetical protein